MTRYAVAFGSNLGDRLGHLRSALSDIARLGELSAISSLYETTPIGGPEQGTYLNAVVVIDSGLDPEALLAGLGGIEDSHGRVRSEKWGPRTLDLDIVTSDGPVVTTPDLQIPHPRARERRFVLEPLAEVWPDANIGSDLTASQARHRVADQEVDLLAATWVHPRPGPGRYWVGAQLVFFLAIGVALIWDGSLPDSVVSIRAIAGALLVAFAAWAAIVSARSLGRAFTAMPEPVVGAELIESGLYGHVRHPIYGAVLLIVFGASLFLASRVGAAISVALAVFFWMKSGYEERQLRIAYPRYSSYRRRVRKRLIPFLV